MQWRNETGSLPRFPGRLRVSSLPGAKDVIHIRDRLAQKLAPPPGPLEPVRSSGVLQASRRSSFAFPAVLQARVGRTCDGVANHRADALSWLQQAHQFQRANRVSHGAAAHAQHSNQFALRRQQVTRFQFFRNPPLQPFGDLLVNLISRDGLELTAD